MMRETFPDRLSALHNDVLGLILLKIPIGDAIRSSVLSRRWAHAHRNMYTRMSELRFSLSLLLGVRGSYPQSVIEEAITNILRLYTPDNVEMFHIVVDVQPWEFTPNRVSSWFP